MAIRNTFLYEDGLGEHSYETFSCSEKQAFKRYNVRYGYSKDLNEVIVEGAGNKKFEFSYMDRGIVRIFSLNSKNIESALQQFKIYFPKNVMLNVRELV